MFNSFKNAAKSLDLMNTTIFYPHLQRPQASRGVYGFARCWIRRSPSRYGADVIIDDVVLASDKVDDHILPSLASGFRCGDVSGHLMCKLGIY
jgi:hypothetical protein